MMVALLDSNLAVSRYGYLPELPHQFSCSFTSVGLREMKSSRQMSTGT